MTRKREGYGGLKSHRWEGTSVKEIVKQKVDEHVRISTAEAGNKSGDTRKVSAIIVENNQATGLGDHKGSARSLTQ